MCRKLSEYLEVVVTNVVTVIFITLLRPPVRYCAAQCVGLGDIEIKLFEFLQIKAKFY